MKLAVCTVDGAGAFSCTPELADAPWEDYTFRRTIAFDTSPGVKGVQLRLRDAGGHETDVQQATIELDNAPPTDIGVTIGDGSGVIGRAEATVRINATGAREMKVGQVSGLAGVAWEPYRSVTIVTFPGPDGQKALFVKLRDGAGNEADEIVTRVNLNTRGELRGRFTKDGASDHGGTQVVLLGTNYAASTSSTGDWSLTGVDAGRYDLVAASPGYRSFRIFDLAVTAAQTRVLGEIPLDAARGRIVGTVFLEGQTTHGGVRITIAGTTIETFTDATGLFSIDTAPVTYAGLRASRTRFADAVFDAPIVVRDDQEFSVGLLILPATDNTLTGRATLEGAGSHSGIRVQATGPATADAMTNAAGDYVFDALPLGRYRLAFDQPAEPAYETVRLGSIDIVAGPPTSAPQVILRERFIAINAGASSTADRDVTLTVGAAGCQMVRVADGADPSTAPWQACPPSGTLQWMLPSGDGDKTVSAQFLTTGNPSVPTQAVTATIQLDTTVSISRFTHDADGRTLGLGSTLRLRLEAGESGGTAIVGISGYDESIELFDVGGGSYTRTLAITAVGDATNADVVALFTDASGNIATRTATAAVTIAIPPLISDVRIDTSGAAGSATIRWRTDETSTGELRWGDTRDVELTEVSPTTGTTHMVTIGGDLAPGVPYYFSVVARDLAGNPASTGARVFFVVPNRPRFVAAIAGVGRVFVRWESPDQGNITGYNVYRSTTSGGPYTKLNTTPYTHEAQLYADPGLTNTTTYYYTVSAIDGSGNESERSAERAATPSPNVGPTLVQGALLGLNVWSEVGSPYIMTSGVAVEPGATLVIGPNTEVRVRRSAGQGGHRFVVTGRFAAIGTDAEPVVIRSDEASPAASDWGQIRIEATSPAGRIDLADGVYHAGNVLHEARVSHAGRSGNTGTWAAVDAGSDIAIARTTMADNAGGGLVSATNGLVRLSAVQTITVADNSNLSMFDSEAVVVANGNTLIRRSTMSGGTRGLSGRGRVDVADSFITNNTHGVYTDDVGLNSRLQGVVRSSTITGNAQQSVGGRLDVVDCYIANNGQWPDVVRLIASRLIDNGGGPLVDRPGRTSSEAVANQFVQSTGGPHAALDGSGAEVHFNQFSGPLSTAPYATVTSVSRGSMTENTFLAPAAPMQAALTTDGSVYSITTPVAARGCYWGDAATVEMRAIGPSADVTAIHDFFDDVEILRVDYSGWKTSALPLARVDSPAWGSEFDRGDAVRLTGHATDVEDGALAPSRLEWRDNNGNLLGTGDALTLTNLNPGRHRIWLFGLDSDDQRGGVVHEIEVNQ